CWTLGVVKPRRSVGHKTGSFEFSAQLRYLPTDIGMIGERLGVTWHLAGADNAHQLAECSASHPKIDGRVGAPRPAARRPPECPDIIRLVYDGIFSEPTLVEDQRIAPRRAHPNDIPIGDHASPWRVPGYQHKRSGGRHCCGLRSCKNETIIGGLKH